MKNLRILAVLLSIILVSWRPIFAADLTVDNLTVNSNATIRGEPWILSGTNDFGQYSTIISSNLVIQPSLTWYVTDQSGRTISRWQAWRSGSEWIWSHVGTSNSVTQMYLDNANRLSLYNSSNTLGSATIVLDPIGTTIFQNSITVNGTNTVMPNQKLITTGSVLTMGLGDVRYPSKSTITTGGAGGGLTATGVGSVAMGYYSQATNYYAVAMGNQVVAGGQSSVAMGQQTAALALNSVAMGLYSTTKGNGAVAMGNNTKAYGNYSLAQGKDSKASGNYSVALGSNSFANAENSLAVGFSSTANGTNSVAIGEYAESVGRDSVAMGFNLHSEGDYSVSMGFGNHSYAKSSVALGEYNLAYGYSSTALGGGSVVSNAYGFAAGDNTRSIGFAAVSMGSKTIAQGYAQTALGQFNIAQGNSSSWTSTDHALIIGNGTSDTNRSNAMTVDWRGNITSSGSLILGSNTVISGRLMVGTNEPSYLNQYGTTLSGGVAFLNKYGEPALNFDPNGQGGSGTVSLHDYSLLVLNDNSAIYAVNQSLKLIGYGGPVGPNLINFYSKNDTVPDMQLTNGNLCISGNISATGSIRVPPQGDISMGTFTNGPSGP